MSAWAEQLHLVPERLAPHLALTLLALALGIALSLPLALLSMRLTALRIFVMTAAGVVQTIPGLALLALMVPLLVAARQVFGHGLPAFGFLPAAMALVIYSVLPILRNAVTGLAATDPAVMEAARGVGLTPTQTLLRVQLPLAWPTIVAGIRISAVWTVGTATLSTPIGQTSLGNFIFSGLQTRNWPAVIIGCVATAALALLIDAGLGQVQRAAAERRRAPLITGAVILTGLVALTFALKQPEPRSSTITIGAKNFTEQYVLAEALAASLNEQGVEATIVEGLGSTVLFDALVNGDIDAAVDYSGTLWSNQLHRTDAASPQTVRTEVALWLDTTHGIKSLGSLGFENTYVFALSTERAQQLGLTSLSQLAGPIKSMRLGSDYEFFSRPEWARVASAYALEPKAQVSFDPSLMYPAVKAGDVELITAFSTDGRINAFHLTVLEDPQRAFPPYEALLLLGPKARRNPRLVAALERWVGAIDLEAMRKANEMVDVEGHSRAEAAAFLRHAAGHVTP